ncbi:GIY-YIG catalytic domain-containing endonuclease [Paramecium bursaria Chlorella virus NW665.2]|nr:GIY-YIG catalytic domain-containing endonuclease [Paramecium bursaria Chlorella virus NW665.2]
MGFIYKLTYKVSRKAYIGQTIRPIFERLKEHQFESSGCRAISNAIKKHGWDNFEKEWYEVPDEDLNFYEEMLVALFGTLAPGGYNLMEGGGSSGKRSEETKQKMKEAKTGEKNHMFGKEHAKESKQKIREAMSGEKHPMYGKTLSEETKQKMSESKTGEKHHNSKKVYQYTLDGTYVDKFASGGEATRALGKSNGSKINECACGDRKTAYGFKWTRELL